MPRNTISVTELLLAWETGDSRAFDRLMPLVYDDLHRRAENHLRRERSGHTLQPTALVNEAYLRLVDQTRARFKNRAQFLAVAAQAMRRILVDHARRKNAVKRGDKAVVLCLDEELVGGVERDVDLIALDDALAALAQIDARQSQIVELRYFGGLTISETAAVLGISPATVKNDWKMARAWLFSQMAGG